MCVMEDMCSGIEIIVMVFNLNHSSYILTMLPPPFRLILTLCLLLSIPAGLEASSKIFQGPIEKVEGDKIYIRSHFTPYSSESLYGKYLNDGEKDGEALMIDLGEVHTTYIDDVPATHEEMLAVVKPGVRVLPFMNRKQWHQVSIAVRDSDVLVGYVDGVKGNELALSRPQADWPAQMSNVKSWSADDFPDRKFSV